MTGKPKRTLPRPTEAELSILRVLWTRGPCSVREVHDALQEDAAATGYTTTLKLMQLMHGKGLVLRDETERAHIYAAAVSRDHTEKQFVTDLIKRLFEGSASRLVVQALGASPPSRREDLVEIKRLLAALEERK
jgi:BlaI family transcriptional regulator, penicillinase repressor